MEFSDETFDLVRSDITLLHVEWIKALTEIRRVLEVGAGDMYSSDEVIINIYDSVLASHRDGGATIRLHFILPQLNFRIEGSYSIVQIQTSGELARGDED